MTKPILVYHPKYKLELGEHVFPGLKYPLVYDALVTLGLLDGFQLETPVPVKAAELSLVHSSDYIEDFIRGKHTLRTFLSEMPLDMQIVRTFLLMCGGTIKAARMALETGVGINLAGGFHHGYPCHAEGFCYLNDVAVAAKLVLKQKPVMKVLILDLDIHQGNGTSYIFKGDPDVFTCSIHQQNIYPPKERSDLDVGLRKGVDDTEYLEILESTLRLIDERFRCDIVFLIAGADILMTDSLGQLMLSKNGIMERDEMVMGWAKRTGKALVLTLGGGYSRYLQDTIDVHVGTLKGVLKKFS
jgi:acetoin utilization deacetylase AcuC-like enzyme